MTSAVRTTIAVIGLTIIAALVGIWLGIDLGKHSDSSSLDEILHNELNLTPDQERRISDIELKFSSEREALEGQMRDANRELARALESEHVYGDRAKRAVERFHDAMARLQEQTIVHILEMRAVLTPGQAAQFDLTVNKALSAETH